MTPSLKTDLPWRPCAGIMLVNQRNEVFVAQRLDTEQNAWQMPQGGIDRGEDPRDAALRELKEEIGTNKAEIIAEMEEWVRYDLPDDLIGKVWKGRWRGQEQKWFLMRFTGHDRDICLDTEHPEFSDWRWVPLRDVPDLVVPFKQAIYRQVCAAFAPHLA
ncbi:RNA pyrophosphohydrolase [Haematospirillum sp. H1815]|uniref:RNA pyrophosphohydrolase n=1 Tax=Haematospirillum sp. H1815 TaxID=2723108 RepID=UPI00143BBA9E|nr:RNA pyrophosphohydrolase [Haematospirillum sp. H1815]NKD77009.1 RNA pyrophosphohydrolase [Haematospirillum sp. H1815]